MRNRGSPQHLHNIPQADPPSNSSKTRKLPFSCGQLLVSLRSLPHTTSRIPGHRQWVPSRLPRPRQACIAFILLVIWLAFTAAILPRTIPSIFKTSSRRSHGHRSLHINIQHAANFRPNWRNDSRCGPGFPPPFGGRISVCDPFVRACCCSAWGWCGEGPQFCNSALVDLRNGTARSGVGQLWNTLLRSLGYRTPFHQVRAEALTLKADPSQLRQPLRDPSGRWDDAAQAAQRVLDRFTRGNTGTEEGSSFTGSGFSSDRPLALRGRDSSTAGAEIRRHRKADGSHALPDWGLQARLAKVEQEVTQALRSDMSQGRKHDREESVIGGSRHMVAKAIIHGAGHPLTSNGSNGKPNDETGLKSEGRYSNPSAGQRTDTTLYGHHNAAIRGGKGGESRGSSGEVLFKHQEQLEAFQSGSTLLPDDPEPGETLADASGLPDEAQVPLQDSLAAPSCLRCNPWRWLALQSSSEAPPQTATLRAGVAAELASGGAAEVGVPRGRLPLLRGKPSLLVIYHYFEQASTCAEDEEIVVMRTNLLYFIRVAVQENDGADYVFSFGGRTDPGLLALVPPYHNVRVRFVDMDTLSSDTCTFRRIMLEMGPRLFEQYTHVAIINNGMRGPFMPSGAETAAKHWAQPFLALLSGEVKLAGAYISCERAVHVQGPFQITDKVGMQFMLDTFAGDKCWSSHDEDIMHSEVGFSTAMLAAGYNVASLQPEYAGVDFRQGTRQLSCRRSQNPTFCCGTADPLSLHWVKYGGEVYRQGLITRDTFRLVEELTRQGIEQTPALSRTTRWQSAGGMLGGEASPQPHTGIIRAAATLWAHGAAAFQAAFYHSRARSGTRLKGPQDASTSRYISALHGSAAEEFRFALYPHISGFASTEGAGSRTGKQGVGEDETLPRGRNGTRPILHSGDDISDTGRDRGQGEAHEEVRGGQVASGKIINDFGEGERRHAGSHAMRATAAAVHLRGGND